VEGDEQAERRACSGNESSEPFISFVPACHFSNVWIARLLPIEFFVESALGLHLAIHSSSSMNANGAPSPTGGVLGSSFHFQGNNLLLNAHFQQP